MIIRIFLALAILLTLSNEAASASRFPQEISMFQGSTLELIFPQHDISQVAGSFEGKKITFYTIEREANFDETISRAEFLHLLFLNNPTNSGISNNSNNPPFPDVPENHPYFDVITLASSLNIIHGYENGNFGPYDTITRGQIAKILVNAFNPTVQLSEIADFPDVPSDHTFFESIRKAISAQIFKGYPDGLMRPDREINFSEAETVIERAANPEIFLSFGIRQYWRAFIGIHRLSNVKTEILKITLSKIDHSIIENSIPIHILKRDFPTVSFSLPPSKTKLFGKEEQDNTWSMINAAKNNPNTLQLWEGRFIIPAEGEETLGFGDKLYINGKYSGSHFGLDWGNVDGTEIFASNNGIVTLADWTPSYGFTTIIDHGQNVFTMYLHQSELKTELWQTVEKGELIGLMGSTGVATGSHLHFTHFIGDIIVDSEEWLDGRW